MPDFSRIISMAYLRILERLPDPDGLANYNRLMNEGLSEALMRESLIRSAEYSDKNPDVASAASRAAARGGSRKGGGRRRGAPREVRKGRKAR